MIVRNDPKTLRSGLVMRWARASTIEKAHQLLTWVWEIKHKEDEADENS